MARIQNNMMANNTHRQYSINNASAARSAEKLSSGYKINRAGDDAAGLAISEKMRAQIRGLNMASKNSQDAVSLIQTAEGALQEVHSMLQRMSELATQSATGTNEDFDRSAISAEFDQLKAEIDDISEQTTFNNMKLLDGSLASGSAKVEVDSVSTLKVGVTKAAFTITKQTGLSNQVGKYTVGVNTTNANAIDVAFVDKETGNTTNTTIDLTTAVKGDFKAGGSFKVDLSAAGMGTFEVTSNDTAAPSAATLATALNTLFMTTKTPTSTTSATPKLDSVATTYEGSTDAPAGVYTITATASSKTLTVTDENGNTASVDASALGASTAGTPLDLSNLNFNNGKTVNLGKFSIAATHDNAVADTDVAQAFNNVKITAPDNTKGGALKIQVGANEGEQLSVSVEAMNAKGLGLTSSTIANQEDAGKALTATKAAINTVSTQRSSLGAMQNRLEHKIKNLDNSAENLQSAESSIRDVDMASEMTEFTKQNILTQAATAMLAQANSAPQNVLQLLG